MKAIDLTHVIKKSHELKWVALSFDNTRVVAFDNNLMNLKKIVGQERVTYMKVPLSGKFCAFQVN